METIPRRLASLFVVGALVFFSPLLGAVNRLAGRVFGLPVLPLYLFGAWALLVAVAWALSRRGRP